MFERRLADFLDQHLGDYVQNFDREQLKVAVWSGEVSNVPIHDAFEHM